MFGGEGSTISSDAPDVEDEGMLIGRESEESGWAKVGSGDDDLFKTS